MNDELLEKKNYIILLMDCYSTLLTSKQQLYLENYYYEDLSISEIAENYDVSRNAVFDQIKRASKTMYDYEDKLKLLEKHLQRKKLIEEIENTKSISNEQLMIYLNKIKEI
jgi:Uncharacterized protein conserved in bacteria